MSCCRRRRKLYAFKKHKPKPLHWVVFFFLVAAATAWFLLDNSNEIVYRRSLGVTPANRRTSFDEFYRDKINDIVPRLMTFCDKYSATVLFAHNAVRDGVSFDDHLFVDCRDKRAFLNAEVTKKIGDDRIVCTEEIAGKFQKRELPRVVYVTGVNALNWEHIEMRLSDMGACIAQHAIDVLDGNW